MTDYNDGNWHGWNGGECPVHPETVVQVHLANMTRMESLAQPASVHGPAGQWIWAHEDPQDETDIIAFRVVRAYRETREFWVAQGGGGYVQVAAGSHPSAFKVREVLE